MKTLAIAALASAGLFLSMTDVAAEGAASPAPLAGKWDIDGGHSSVVFKVKHAGASWFYGDFEKISGSFAADGKDSKMSILIDSTSIDTNDDKRDAHLKSPDFFDAKQFPDITFESTSVSPKGDDYAVDGDLTVRGKTKQISIAVRKTGEGEFRGKRVGYETEFVIKRSEFDMNYGIAQGVLGDEVHVMVAVELVEAK